MMGRVLHEAVFALGRGVSRGAKSARCLGWLGLVGATWLAACAQPTAPKAVAQPPAAPAETLLAVTADGALIRFNAASPTRMESRLPLVGLPAGESLVGIDFRVAKGVLYAVARSGRVFTLNTATAQLTPVAGPPVAVPLRGTRFGVDFNPAADRIRVVSDTGQNLRLHPDTGAVVDFDANQAGIQPDPDVRYAPGDAQAGQNPQLVSAAYTYNTRDEKITTNFALDARLGTLVTQGSREGAVPVESPNLGVLHTVGALGTGPLVEAGFDISDVRNTAWAALRPVADGRTALYRIDLSSGEARWVGPIGGGQALLGLAIEP